MARDESHYAEWDTFWVRGDYGRLGASRVRFVFGGPTQKTWAVVVGEQFMNETHSFTEFSRYYNLCVVVNTTEGGRASAPSECDRYWPSQDCFTREWIAVGGG